MLTSSHPLLSGDVRTIALLSCESQTELFLLAIVEAALRGDVDSPARLETALDVGELLQVGGRVLAPTAAAPRTEDTGGGGGGGGLVLLPLLPLLHLTITEMLGEMCCLLWWKSINFTTLMMAFIVQNTIPRNGVRL